MAIIICQRSELWWFWKGFWKECMVMEFDIHENMWSKNILCKKFGCSPKGAVEVSCWRKVLLLAGTSALILFYSRVATNSEHPSPWKCKVLWYIHVYDIELRHFSWVAGLATLSNFFGSHFKNGSQMAAIEKGGNLEKFY